LTQSKNRTGRGNKAPAASYRRKESHIFPDLESIHSRPKPFEFYTAEDLWTDEHTSARMLAHHLDGDVDISSRRTAFIDRSAEWIHSRFGLSPESAVADFGCGPGLYAIRLARKGVQVTGIDFSQRSLQYAAEAAKKEGLDIRYVCENYLAHETTDRYDLILMIFCDFCALSPDQRGGVLDKWQRMLKHGGRILLDVYSTSAFDRRREGGVFRVNPEGGFWSAGRYYEFQSTFTYGKERVALDKYTIVEAARTRTVYNWLQYFDRDGLAREFAAAGLRVTDWLGDVAGTPYDPEADEFAVVASAA
jgi:SAM-dependent methyltransferase